MPPSAPSPVQHRYLEDAFVRAQIDLAVRLFVGAVPDDELGFMRVALAHLLEDDPAAAELLNAARPRSVDESGACDKIDAVARSAPANGAKTA